MGSKIKMGVRTTTKFISVVDEKGHEILNFCMEKMEVWPFTAQKI